ncbi:MAG: DNA gyrase subunit A [Magnetococcus sp. WYHC-3]
MSKKEEEKKEENDQEERGIVNANITTEMRTSYLDYAMSVITARALPDVRDGLKPVQRRILFVMHELGLTSHAKHRKCAKICGDTSGNYHPHGESNVYGALVNMAQYFSMRYPLVGGQGNFGSIDGDPPAAMRYTEARLASLSSEILKDISKETVDWRSNYDNTKKEPTLLPSGVPNLILNGTLGIAVGMASSIPPHNLREVVDATVYLIDNPQAATEDLMQFIKGPDFPTGGVIFNKKDILHAYTTGKGGVVVRGEAEIIESKSGSYQIIITSIPYRVNKAELIEKIADLVREKKLEGIKGLRDESTKDIRIAIDIKSGAHPQNVLNYIYKHTQLEETFHFNTVALVDGVPQTLSLKSILEEFIKHRKVVVRRRTEYDLRKAEEREHILLGLKKALDHIDEIIALIKKSKDVTEAHANLIKRFKFSDRQATAILEMKLQRLAGLERKKIEDELFEIQKLIAELKDLLANPKKILSTIKKEMSQIAEKYGDNRLTKVSSSGVKNLSLEDLVSDEESVLVLTKGGYVKRTNPDEFKKQKRGGVGVIDLDTKDEDFVTMFVSTSNHSDLLFFTDKGKAYQMKMYEVPEGHRATKGKSIMNFLALSDGEHVTSVVPISKDQKKIEGSLLMVTKQGISKKVAASSLHDVRRSGIIAIKLSAGDELISVIFVEKGDSVILGTTKGQSIRFKESDIREMGRSAAGVRAMKFAKDDFIISADVIKKSMFKNKFLIFSENGYAKLTDIEEYKIQNRGGSGIKTAAITSKNGKLISATVVTDEMSEIVAISKKGQVIRTGLDEIPTLGRQTQGVRVMKLRPGDNIASLTCL